MTTTTDTTDHTLYVIRILCYTTIVLITFLVVIPRGERSKIE